MSLYGNQEEKQEGMMLPESQFGVFCLCQSFHSVKKKNVDPFPYLCLLLIDLCNTSKFNIMNFRGKVIQIRQAVCEKVKLHKPDQWF